jgi:subtilisin-like proprotein convertase family protein
LNSFIKPIGYEIGFINAIHLVVHSPAPVCFPATINLADPQITLGSDLDGVQLTYWEDAEATIVLANHTSLTESGTYYIKATNQDLETMVLPVVVVVNQTPTISSISDRVLCKGDTQGAIPLISSVSNTSFVWNNSNNTIGLAESGTTNLEIPSFVALGNSLSAPTTGTITVQPTANGCTGNSTSFMVTVNPLPIATISGTTSICKDAASPTITFTGYYSTPPYTFTYQINGGIEQTIATISGNSTTLIVPTGIPGVFTYSIKRVASSTGCSQLQTGSSTVTVNPFPFVTAPPDQNLCNGLMSSIIGLSGTPSSVVFDITGGTSIGLGDKIGVTEIPSFRPTSGSATITIIPRANGCVGLPVNFTIAVSPIPTMSSSPAYQTICSGATTNISLTSSTPGTTFAWTVGAIVPSGGVTNATNGTGNIINQSLTNTTSSNATVTYQVTPSINGCSGTTLNIVVTVKPPPNLVITHPPSLCSPATVDLTASTVTAGSASGLDLSYWTNADATNSLSNPSVVGNGTYYVKAIEPGTGCSIIKPVDVSIHLTPSVIITNPAPLCSPSKGNLTLPAVTTGSTTDLTFTYWINAGATLSYPTPTSADNGTYYIKGTTSSGCYDIKPVTVAVYSAPEIPVFTLGPSSNSCKNSAPITFTANATTAISLTYGLDAASLTAGNTINANTGEVTFAANWIGTSVITATATSCGVSRTATHTVKVNPLPLVTLVASPSTAVCEGVPVTLTATSTGPTVSGSSGNINKTIPNNTNASYAYSTITLSGSGESLAATDLIEITLTINHHYDSDLDIFLVDPSGNKAMLLTSDYGGSNNDYINTVFRTDAATLISSGSAPFTGTYRPEGTITTAPDRSGAVSGGNYNVVVPANSLEGALINGAWSLRVFDDANNDSGILNNWSLSITKQTVGNFTTIVNGPQVIGAIAYSGTSNSVAKSVVTPPVGTNNYTVTTTDANGCTATSNQVAVVVKETPDATVIADYCSIQPKIKLTATGTGTYLWSTGETTKFISVDVVGIYTVTVTGSNGCQATGSINVSNELVTNGDFSSGNTGFTTPLSGTNQYTYKADLTGVNNELNPEGLYGIGTNANNYHSNFWGVDHTSGAGNFMIVNGFPGTPQPVVWQQVKTVVPNTDYYFSAYAISLNTAGNYANLQFSINGTTFGTNAQLTSGTGSDSNPWKPEDRFYGMWNSGSATSAIIQIVDLQTAPNGNDFGLDDISFGTLAPLPGNVNPTTTSEICEGTTINLAANLTGGKSPFTYQWTGPNNFSSSLENPSIPNASDLNSGDYSLTFYDGYGCTPITKSVTVNVSNISTVNAGTDQSFCAPVSSIRLDGRIGGSATSATWVGGLGTFDPNRTDLNAKYTPSNDEIESGSLTLTLTTDPVGACPVVSDQVTFTIYPLVTAAIQDVVNPLCFGNYDGSARASVDGGTGPFSYSWNTSPPQTTATAYNLNAGTFSVTITDSHGCSDSESVTLTEPAALVVDENLQITQPDCISITSGSATVRIISGDSPTFLWSDGQTTATANNLLPGTYTITVTSVNGCSQIALQAIILPPDILPPTFAVPPPFIQCVESLNNAIYNSSTMDINPDRPDYYIFPSGNTSLDLDPLVFTDNCPLSCTTEIRWKIEMKDGTRIPALPLAYFIGQPSTYGSPIQFSGDGLGFGDTAHTITYWVVDCAGNVSDPQSQTILIQPRPNVVKGL